MSFTFFGSNKSFNISFRVISYYIVIFPKTCARVKCVERLTSKIKNNVAHQFYKQKYLLVKYYIIIKKYVILCIVVFSFVRHVYNLYNFVKVNMFVFVDRYEMLFLSKNLENKSTLIWIYIAIRFGKCFVLNT